MRLSALAITVVLTIACAGCVRIVNPARARVFQLVGIIEEPRTAELRLKTADNQSDDIRTDMATHYAKWITHQPWVVDQFVDRRALKIGRCVKVTLRETDPHVAKRVEVHFDPAGSFSDPCNHLR